MKKTVLILSQSCTMDLMYQTVIDLDNNEVVVITYRYYTSTGSIILSVQRTGMFADITKQISFSGTDAPFKKDN